MLTRMLASDKGWFKGFTEAKKATDDYSKIVDKIAKQAGKK